MKKNILLIISIIIFGISLSACGDKSSDDDKVVFQATVIENNGGLLVTPVEGSSELRSADKIYVRLESNESNAIEEFKVGDLVEITYNGLIAESYPAQIWASKIEIIQNIGE